MKVTMAHGSGGESTSGLIKNVFAKYFNNDILNRLEDSAVVPGNSRLAMTTDSFVVTPIEFPGGNIGRLSVCGTVNDLLMSGSKPMYITCGFILEEGLDLDILERQVKALSECAKEAGVTIVTGDTKVIENRGGEPGLSVLPILRMVMSSFFQEISEIIMRPFFQKEWESKIIYSPMRHL